MAYTAFGPFDYFGHDSLEMIVSISASKVEPSPAADLRPRWMERASGEVRTLRTALAVEPAPVDSM